MHSCRSSNSYVHKNKKCVSIRKPSVKMERASLKSRKSSSRKGRVQRALSRMGSSMYELGRNNAAHDTVINSLLTFGKPVDREAVLKSVKACFTDNWRFRATISRNKKSGEATWFIQDEDPDFDFHVENIEIPTAEGDFANQQDINLFVSSFYGKMLPEDKPLWIVYNITNVRDAGLEGKVNGALLIRLHHNIGDGISLMAFVNSFFDKEEKARPTLTAQPSMKPKDIWPKVPPALQLLHQARVFVQGVFNGLLMPVLPGDVDTLIKHPEVRKIGHRIIATSSSVELSLIKDIKNNAGMTINDVLVAALSGVIRKYTEAQGSKIVPGQSRAMCLINMRDGKAMRKIMKGKGELGNQFNFLPIAMPLDEKDGLERMYQCKLTLDDLKHSPLPVVSFGLNILASMVLPAKAYANTTCDLFNKVTTVFSNVPGPAGPVFVAAMKVLNMSFFANSLTATVFGLVSYNNKVALSVVADTSVVPNPQSLVDEFEGEIMNLYQLTRGKFRKPELDPKRVVVDAAVVGIAALVLLLVLILVFKIII